MIQKVNIQVPSPMQRLLPALLVLLTFGFSDAHGAIIDLAKDAQGNTKILVAGEILRGDDERFATVAGNAPDDVTVILDSPGGNLVTGLRIGSAIRMRAWKTAVPESATCASACGLMWLGGVQRTVGPRARVGFHAAWIEGPNGSKREVGSGNALVGSYLGRLGLTDEAVVYLTSAPPEGAAWLTEVISKQVGIRAEFMSGEHQQIALATPPRGPVNAKPPTRLVAGTKTATQAALLQELYSNFPASVRLPNGESCSNRACILRLLGEERWTTKDGDEHIMLVAVAEVKDDCHACAAVLSIGQFRHSSSTDSWHKEILMPAVERVGGYGVFGGTVSFVDGGSLGRALILQDSGGGMGEFGSAASIFVATNGKFKQALIIPLSLSVDASCDIKETECRKKVAQSNYDSKLSVVLGVDAQLHVDQTFTAAIQVPPASWVIDSEGQAKQTSGGKVGLGSNAEERATLSSPAYDQGRSDRAGYEAWFSGLQGDARAGAESWAGRRSLRTPGNCEQPPGQSPQWAIGCDASRKRLAPVDARRRSEPDYRRGWNSA